MIQGIELSSLSSWQSFYMIIGTAAATLMGLMFVAVTLIAGSERRESTLNAGISAFNTPTVVQFGEVLLMAVLLSAPWQAFNSLSLLMGVLGLGGVLYLIIVMRRMRRFSHYQTTLQDWLWYMVLPLCAHVMLVIAAMLLPANSTPALYVIGTVMILLLFLGIRNSWDLVTYIAIERSRPENKSKE